MISNLNFALFPSRELFTFCKTAIATIDAKQDLIPAIVPFLTNASTKLVYFQSALERDSKNPFIKKQSDMDKNRIDAFMAFRNFCESASTRRKEGVPAAAEAIIATIRKHAWTIQTLGQKSRTATISNIISEIKTRFSIELALIGGDELLDELTHAQLDYEASYHKVIETASETFEPTVAEARPELTAAFKALFQIIGLQEISAPSADVTSLIASLNELITISLATVKASDTRAGNAKKELENQPAEIAK
jgi:hypothetical protein